MLKVNNITYSYAVKEKPIFSDFSLALPENSICGLLGRNGAGKSTLLYIMCGLLRPQAGSATVDDVDVKRRRPETLRDIYLVPEEFDLPAVRLDEYVRLNADFYPHFSYDVLRECLADFDLPTDLRLGRLSMGQKKKVMVSFALATSTRLLLMDEPTNGLDIPSKSQFRKVLSRHMQDDRTVVISTHQVRDVDVLLDHITMIDQSRLVLNASTADICDALAFDLQPIGEPVDDALYVEPSLQGNAVIRCNDDHRDTPLNLELLFNAMLEKANVLSPIINR